MSLLGLSAAQRFATALVMTWTCCAAQDLAEVSGRILDSVTKQGVPGAKVILFRQTRGGRFSDSIIAGAAMKADDPAAEMLAMSAGPEGQFRFSVTVPGDFMVFVKCDGYVNGQLARGPGSVLRLKPGDSRTGLAIEIEKEGSISGRITDAETGLPVRGLAVVPMRWRSGGGTRALVFSGGRATTDSQGLYELKGLSPGEYLLKVQPPILEKFLPGGTAEAFRDRIACGYPRSYYPGAERREQSSPVTLLAGGRLDRTDMKIAKRRVASIRGTVLAGAGGEAREVHLGLSETEIQGNTQSFRIVARGKWRVGEPFRLDNLPPGHYVLIASAQGAGDLEGAILQFEMDDRSQDRLDLTLTGGVTVSGAVKMHESFSVALPAQPPLKLLWRPLGRSSTAWDVAPVLVEPDGRFLRTGLMPGCYRLQLFSLSKGMQVGEVRYNGNPVERGVVTLNAGALGHQVDLVIWPATASIAVTARQGMKAGADVQLVALREPIDDSDPQADALLVQADGEGRGTFSNLLPGKYRLLALSPGANWRTDGRLAERLTGATVVEVGIGAAQAVELKVAEQ